MPVLRAGLGMLEAFLDLVPSAEVGYFGLERDETTAVARRYYEKVPADLGSAVVFLLDPMLATGGSAAMAVEGLEGMGARRVRLVSIVAAPEGVDAPADSPPPASRSTPRRWTGSSTSASTSSRVWATSATASTAPDRRRR